MYDSFGVSVDINILMVVNCRMFLLWSMGGTGFLSVLCLSLLGCSVPCGVGIVSESLLLLQLWLVLSSVLWRIMFRLLSTVNQPHAFYAMSPTNGIAKNKFVFDLSHYWQNMQTVTEMLHLVATNSATCVKGSLLTGIGYNNQMFYQNVIIRY